MQRLPIVLLLLGLIGTLVAGVLLLRGDDPVAPPPSASEDPAPLGETADPATADPVEASEPETVASDDEPAASDEGTDTERTVDPGDVAANDGPLVRVVRGPQNDPVADADVFFLTHRDGETRNRGGSAARTTWPETWGKRVRTGIDGTVTLPPSREGWLVSARSGDEFAFAAGRGKRPIVLALLPDETLRIATRTKDDSPAPGVPFALHQGWVGQDARRIWDGETGADGTAIVLHFQLVRQGLPPPGNDETRAEAFLAIALVASAEPAMAAFGGRPAARDPVVLFVPALGSLEVQLTDHSGTPLLSPATITAMPDPPPRIDQPLRIQGAVLGQTVQKAATAEAVEIARIAFAPQVRLSAKFDHDRRAAFAVVAGPGTAGTNSRRLLAPAPHQVVVAGRLLLADGTPVGAAAIPAVLVRGENDGPRVVLHPIADGRFDIVLAGRPGARDFAFEVRHSAATNGDQPRRELGARVRVPDLEAGHRVELGDIVLTDLPLLAEGLVVDDRGEPVANADVRIQRLAVPAPGSPPDAPPPWRDVPHQVTRSGPDGSFTFFGPMPPVTLRVRADTDLHFADSVPLQTAGQRLRVCILRCGIVRGRAILPDWIPDGAASLVLQPFDETLRERETRRTDLARRAGGRFRVEPLRPGRYDAIVTLRNVAKPLLTIPDVFVVPGDTADRRLDEIDLRQAIQRYRLRAVDPRGIPIAVEGPILVRTENDDGRPVEAAFRWRSGRAEILSPAAVAEVTFFGRGIAPQRTTLGPGDHDIVLQVLRPAIVEVPGARALCGPTRRVRVSVILTEATGMPESLQGTDQRSGERFGFARWDLGKSSGAWLGASDTVEVPIMKSGKYEIVLRAHATSSERTAQASLSLGTFELEADSAAPRTVTVPIDSQALVQMLADLDARHADQLKNEQNQRR
ncbi:MAG: hypothetical protein JNK78_20820 [Planctomycetes bacterium]|nr:hypothetical protein [Planctomycetota bacterium]